MITLAIETAIRGGSLSLIENNQEIDAWIGNKNVSKAEDVLEQISDILKNNGVKKTDLIVVSNGPGSSTGIRIGLATALGLKKSFNCGIVGVSVFEAIMFNKIFDKPTLLAIPVGSKQIAWQVFEKDISHQRQQAAEIKYGSINVFLKLLNKHNFAKMILHSELTKVVSSVEKTPETTRIKVMDDKFATLIGLRGNQIFTEKDKNNHYASDNVKAIYPNNELNNVSST